MPNSERPAWTRRDHAWRALLAASAIGFSWLGFQGLHELGHCLNAWVSGGEVERVVLGPLALSRTDLGRNPHPVFVGWGGAFWGTALPLALWGAAAAARLRAAYLLRFLAGFCAAANGAYLFLDAFARAGDGAVLVARGALPVWPALFGLAGAATGLLIWHGTGARFGLGPDAQRPSPADAIGVAAALAALVLLEIVAFGG